MASKHKNASKRIRRFFFQPVEKVLFFSVLGLLRILPISLAIRFGGLVGTLSFSLFRFRRKVTLANLAFALPELSPAKRIAIGRRSYAHQGRAFMELLMLKRIDEAYVDRHVEIIGFEHAEAAQAEGQGFLGVTGHFGSWELLAATYCIKGFPLDAVASVQKNQGVSKVINELRAHHGMRVIPLKSAVKGVIRALREKRCVALLSDQDIRGGAGVVVDFFNHPTRVPEGAALFNIKTGARIICTFIVRKGTGQDHLLTMEAPLEYELTGDRKEDVQRIVQHHATVLEDWIRRYPDHWFWGHKRWKSMGLYE